MDLRLWAIDGIDVLICSYQNFWQTQPSLIDPNSPPELFAFVGNCVIGSNTKYSVAHLNSDLSPDKNFRLSFARPWQNDVFITIKKTFRYMESYRHHRFPVEIVTYIRPTLLVLQTCRMTVCGSNEYATISHDPMKWHKKSNNSMGSPFSLSLFLFGWLIVRWRNGELSHCLSALALSCVIHTDIGLWQLYMIQPPMVNKTLSLWHPLWVVCGPWMSAKTFETSVNILWDFIFFRKSERVRMFYFAVVGP